MAFPENVLADGEQVVVHHHPHWKFLLLPSLIFIVATVAAGVALGFINGSSLSDGPTLWLSVVVAVLWLLIVVWFFGRPTVSWISTHFVLTDRRVMWRRGVIRRSGIDIPLQRINTVEFSHGLLDRMLGTGTLIIESASDDPLTFADIPHVKKVHALLYNEVYDNEVR